MHSTRSLLVKPLTKPDGVIKVPYCLILNGGKRKIHRHFLSPSLFSDLLDDWERTLHGICQPSVVIERA